MKLYNNTAPNILEKEINLLLPQIPRVQNVELSPCLYLAT